MFGKLLFNARKNSLITKLITEDWHYERLINSVNLDKCTFLSDEALMLRYHSPEISFNHPIVAGFFVLERAKALMFETYHLKLKEWYKDQINLIYTDTDSFILKFTELDAFEQMKNGKLSELMDCSNMTGDMKDTTNAGVLGKLKSETSTSRIVDVICLQPKVYSILLDDDTCKTAVKGINFWLQKNITHRNYVDIYDGLRDVFNVTVTNINSKCYKLFTIRHEKRALCRLDLKRYYKSKNLSYGFDHPLCEKQAVEGRRSDVKIKRLGKRKLLAGNNDHYSYHIVKGLQAKITRYMN